MSGDITRHQTDAELEQHEEHTSVTRCETDSQEADYCVSDLHADELEDGDLEDGLDAIDGLGGEDYLADELEAEQQTDETDLDEDLDEDLDDELDTQLDAEPDDSELEVDILADLLEEASDVVDDDPLASIVDDAKLRPGKRGGSSLEARRAIEERAEMRRMERDLNYLDFDLDD